jgi:hypothetical protein
MLNAPKRIFWCVFFCTSAKVIENQRNAISDEAIMTGLREQNADIADIADKTF